VSGRCPDDLEDQFIADCKRLATYELCEKYDRAPSTIKEWRVGLYHQKRLRWWPGIQLGTCQVYDDHIVLDDDVVIISDLEIPYHDVELLGYAVSVGKMFGITTLVIAGDFLALDALGYWPNEDTDLGGRYTVDDSLLEGEVVLRGLLQWFQKVILIKGNHEQRGTRQKEWAFFRMMQRQWEELGDVELSYYKWCIVQDKRIEHPANYRKVPGSVARERAEIENTDTVCAHNHHFSYSFTRDGQHQAIDLGHSTRPETRYYKAVNGTTCHPKWVRGFWVLRKGFFYGFPVDFTDWDFWLNNVKVEG
jgi:hypothetical protein